jgi:NAD-dependent deacetylase
MARRTSDDVDLPEARALVQQARRVVFLCGAGLSVPSGIRAYRSGPNAIWGEHVLEWGTRAKFLDDPALWWREFWLKGHGDLFKKFEPNAAHHALVEFMGRKAEHLVITQNIDGLHRLAGHPEGQLIEIHGRHDRFVCSSDGGCEGIDHPVGAVDLSKVAENVFPKCPHCGAPMRPNVLLFDEHYDSHEAFQAWRARKALNDADLLVFVGTSFSVGITSYAVRCADVSGAVTINVNVERSTLPGLRDLLGGAETVLPALLA